MIVYFSKRKREILHQLRNFPSLVTIFSNLRNIYLQLSWKSSHPMIQAFSPTEYKNTWVSKAFGTNILGWSLSWITVNYSQTYVNSFLTQTVVKYPEAETQLFIIYHKVNLCKKLTSSLWVMKLSFSLLLSIKKLNCNCLICIVCSYVFRFAIPK